MGVGRYLLFFFNFFNFFCGVFVRFSTRGVQKHHKKLFGENTCQKLLAEKVEIFFFFPFRLYPAPLCVSQQGEFKNTIKHFLGEIHVKNFWPKNLRKKNLFSFRLFPSIFFYRVFGRFSA
jgi:hypothetical protein